MILRFIPGTRRLLRLIALGALLLPGIACYGSGDTARYDLVIRAGMIYDGNGGEPYQADIGISGERITAIGDLEDDAGDIIDAEGLAVAPGFINMLSWATRSLLVDGRSQSNIRQGVTLEVFGEGTSPGPLSAAMRDRDESGHAGKWTTLGEYLDFMVERGVSPNVASFVGATTVRIHELGYEDRAPGTEELERMRQLVRQAMEEGALGLGSSLIYAPAFYAETPELVELAKVVGEYGGMYISHLRSEGNRLLEALDELIHIAREANVPAEIYHLKAAGRDNWQKFEKAVAMVEAARAAGLHITADMYAYTAGSTGLNASMPPWVQEGGYDAWAERLQDPSIRQRVLAEMTTPTGAWENLGLAAGPDGILLVGFDNAELRRYTGMTLAQVAAERKIGAAETAIDLVIEDGSRVQAIYFLMSEENVSRGIALPWVSFGSDAASIATEGVFLERSTHPRAYGNFARVIGKYVRAEEVISLPEAVRKLTRLPAANLKIRHRGELREGYYADVVVFDPEAVQDHASYDHPHQYASGILHVLVNGEPVLRDGEHTGALPGQVVRGPGWTGWRCGNC